MAGLDRVQEARRKVGSASRQAPDEDDAELGGGDEGMGLERVQARRKAKAAAPVAADVADVADAPISVGQRARVGGLEALTGAAPIKVSVAKFSTAARSEVQVRASGARPLAPHASRLILVRSARATRDRRVEPQQLLATKSHRKGVAALESSMRNVKQTHAPPGLAAPVSMRHEVINEETLPKADVDDDYQKLLKQQARAHAAAARQRARTRSLSSELSPGGALGTASSQGKSTSPGGALGSASSPRARARSLSSEMSPGGVLGTASSPGGPGGAVGTDLDPISRGLLAASISGVFDPSPQRPATAPWASTEVDSDGQALPASAEEWLVNIMSPTATQRESGEASVRVARAREESSARRAAAGLPPLRLSEAVVAASSRETVSRTTSLPALPAYARPSAPPPNEAPHVSCRQSPLSPRAVDGDVNGTPGSRSRRFSWHDARATQASQMMEATPGQSKVPLDPLTQALHTASLLGAPVPRTVHPQTLRTEGGSSATSRVSRAHADRIARQNLLTKSMSATMLGRRCHVKPGPTAPGVPRAPPALEKKTFSRAVNSRSHRCSELEP